MKLLLYALLLCPFICGAQNIHKKDLIGKWYIQRMVQNGNVVIDRSDENAGLQTAIKRMRQNTGYTADDSLAVVDNYHEKIKTMDNIFMAFYDDGHLEMTNMHGGGLAIKDQPKTGTYKLDEATGILTITADGRDDDMKASIQDKMLVLSVDETYVKVTMEWKKK